MAAKKIVIIGFGALMEKFAPCYEKLLGDEMAGNIIATTQDESDIERKRSVFPFEFRLGDNRGALEAMKPDIIIFAVPPQLAMAVTEADLVPYYEECRAKGEKIPVLYVFPPRPAADFYLGKLGEDLTVCHILPNVILSIGGKPLEGEGLNFITISPKSSWSEEDKKTIEQFMSGTGACIYMEPQKVMAIMTSGVGVINYALILKTMAEALKKAGYDADVNKAAEISRAALSTHTGLEIKTDAPRDTGLPEAVKQAVSAFTVRYYDGLRRYVRGLGLDEKTAKEFLDRYFDFYLHFYMCESEERLDGLLASQTTKGGVAEKGKIVYREAMEDKLFDEFSKIGEKCTDEAFFDGVEEYIVDCSKQVLAHGMSMGGKK